MEEFVYDLKNFTWDGDLRIKNISMVQNRLTCRAESFESAELSANLFLDLIAFLREKDVYFESAHHVYVEQANRLRTYTTTLVPEHAISASDLKTFVAKAYPRLQDQKFRDSTGVLWALRFYLAALGIEFLPARFMCFFSGLEILLTHVLPRTEDASIAGLIQAVKKVPSIPNSVREMAAARLAVPNLTEKMKEFVRSTGLPGVAFQNTAKEEIRFRFDEILRLREEIHQKGYVPPQVQGESSFPFQLFLGQLRDLVRESISILLIH